MRDNSNSWLKSMQNGSIGEARTKSFLIDRFWILERSVDVDGTDFLIQRHLEDKNLFDKEPPKFGRVQSKFSQDENTSHYVKKEYVIDNEGKPRLDFFLIVNIGNESNSKMYLLFSKDLQDFFHLNNEKGFYINPKKAFSDMFLIQDKSLSLDRIDNSIRCVDFYKNRSFLSLHPSKPDFKTVLPEFKEDIEYWFGKIPERFEEYKNEAYQCLLEIEKAHDCLKKYVEAVDPIEAFLFAEELHYVFQRDFIKLPYIYDKDFYYNLKHHKDVVSNLKNDGALDNYLNAKNIINESVNKYLDEYDCNQINFNSTHSLTIEYETEVLKITKVLNSINNSEDIDQNKYLEFKETHEGLIIVSYKIGLGLKNDGIVKFNEVCLREIVEKMYELKYYECD